MNKNANPNTGLYKNKTVDFVAITDNLRVVHIIKETPVWYTDQTWLRWRKKRIVTINPTQEQINIVDQLRRRQLQETQKILQEEASLRKQHEQERSDVLKQFTNQVDETTQGKGDPTWNT